MAFLEPPDTEPLERQKRTRRRLPHILIFFAIALPYILGTLDRFEHALMDLRFLSFDRQASGNAIQVGIDSKSIKALNIWPWRRSFHADMVRRLNAAGAHRIVLDIDLSSHASPSDDADLAAAIREAEGKVVLPVFKQRAPGGGNDLVYTFPLSEFRDHAQTASVNIQANMDSLIRQYNRIEDWQNTRIPALATQLIGQLPDTLDPFYIDFSIRPDGVPYLSYIDVLRDEVPLDAIKGRIVIVGATAVELGDMLAVPVYRSLPGSMLQILAFESLKQGRAIQRTNPAWSLLAILLLSCFLGPRIAAWSWQRGLIITLGTAGSTFFAAAGLQYLAPLSADISPLLLVLTLSYVWSLIQTIDIQSLGLFKQRMATSHIRALMSSVVNESFDGILITNAAGQIQFSNPMACALLERSSDEISDQDIQQYLHIDEAQNRAPPEGGEDALKPRVLVKARESELYSKSGTRIPVEYSAMTVPFALGKGPLEVRTTIRYALIYTLHDVRDSQKAAIALREAHDQLEEKVTERTAQLEQARDEAQAANTLKSQLLTTMSHELRTPLTSIIGSLRLVKEGVVDRASDEANGLIDIAWRNSVQLAKLVNNIIDTERFEAQSQKLDQEPLDFTELVNQAIDLNSGYANEYQVTITGEGFEPDAWVYGDRDRLLQVMANLLSNAVKFSPKGATVQVSLLRHGQGYRLSVRNSGEAIPFDIRGKIFEKYVRGNNTDNRNVGGAGLGLGITRAIIEEHGGHINFTSSNDKGTTFFFDLPEIQAPEIAVL